jgi:hypothetical protein
MRITLLKHPYADHLERHYGNLLTVAMRKSFEIPSAVDPALHLMLSMDQTTASLPGLMEHLISDNSPNAPTEPALNADATDP